MAISAVCVLFHVGMKWSEIRLRDVGPIEQGTIGNNRVNVFVGPNNSGKSIASRVIYGLRQLGDNGQTTGEAALLRMLDLDGKAAGPLLAPLLIAKNAGIDIGDVATYGKPGGWIEVGENGSSTRFSFERNLDERRRRFARRVASADAAATRDGIYIPAGRTGIMQSLLQFLQIKNDLLNTIWLALDENPPKEARQAQSLTPSRIGLRRRRIIPEYLERFNDLVLEAASEGLTDDARGLFAKLFEGSVEIDDSYNPPQMYYRDSHGFITKIDSAGSGTVSSFPIIASLDRIEPGGTLIIEETEAHMEPLNQQRMIAEVVKAATTKDVSLLFTTHSEYVVYPLLSMVSHGDLEPGDLGIYYFNRKPNSYTRVEKIDVSKDGDVDRELFKEALDALGTRP